MYLTGEQLMHICEDQLAIYSTEAAIKAALDILGVDYNLALKQMDGYNLYCALLEDTKLDHNDIGNFFEIRNFILDPKEIEVFNLFMGN